MAITVFGGSGTFGAVQWAKQQRIMGELNWREGPHQIGNKLTPSLNAGTRVVTIDSGDAIVPGCLVESTTPVSVAALPTVSGSNIRIDYIVMEVVWPATPGANTTATFKSVQGVAASVPSEPNLTRSVGNLWQMPIARVRLTAADATLTPCIPQPRAVYAYGGPTVERTVAAGGDWSASLLTLNIADPGWPYLIETKGIQYFDSVTNGFGLVQATVGGTEVIDQGRAPFGNAGPGVLSGATTLGARTGASTVRFEMKPHTTMTQALHTTGGLNFFYANVLPA